MSDNQTARLRDYAMALETHLLNVRVSAFINSREGDVSSAEIDEFESTVRPKIRDQFGQSLRSLDMVDQSDPDRFAR